MTLCKACADQIFNMPAAKGDPTNFKGALMTAVLEAGGCAPEPEPNVAAETRAAGVVIGEEVAAGDIA